MDESHSESDLSLSPSQILQRLQVLRQLQLMQRGKLQKHRLQYKETSETSSSITEIVSHFSNSTSYNTFRSLLQSSNDISNDGTPRLNTSDYSQKLQEKDLIEGVSILNLSQESEFIVNSPLSIKSRTSASSKGQETSKESDKKHHAMDFSHNTTQKSLVSSSGNSNITTALSKKQISLEEMPILSPKKNFEALLLEKLQNEKTMPKTASVQEKSTVAKHSKKPFLRRGEGIARFGLKKNTVVIQNTKSLPWKRKSFQSKPLESPLKETIKKLKNIDNTQNHGDTELMVPKLKLGAITRKPTQSQVSDNNEEHSHQHARPPPTNNKPTIADKVLEHSQTSDKPDSSTCLFQPMKAAQKIEFSKNKHPLVINKGKTWAAVLTKEQNDFLQQLKQSDYYKNFMSPTKSVVSDASCDEAMSKIRLEREIAEQNMFDMLENKVSHESFNLENSFFNRFLRRSNLECSGESTPLVMQKCLSDNPDLMHILPELNGRNENENSYSDAETCCSNTDCCCDASSTVSCCSCKTVEESKNSTKNCTEYTNKTKKGTTQNIKKVKINSKEVDDQTNQDDTITETDTMKANMAEMNAKLVATSELLKERLHELEDEIETFRKENATLAKMRDEIDQDRQKFYEDKASFEQKLNEEKVLAEYYLAEEKEKLSKQKQMYERYVREMRGRLNKKDKDEVVNLKKEISDLKEEIRIKDAKSTSTIARLRNQIKIMEKEKKELQDEVEKLKKQNRRIQHSNEVTRRLTNIKYLEEINKKLTNMSNKDSRAEVSVDRDVKYKAYEIERQSRSRKVEPTKPRQRAKSVPNLNVTSRYAKYFSQRDTSSQRDQIRLMNVDSSNNSNENLDVDDDIISNASNNDGASNEDDNYLEKMYMERFRPNSPKSNRSSDSNSKHEYNFTEKPQLNDNTKDFFLQKSNSISRNSKSPRSLSPNFNKKDIYLNRSKSPVSVLSNKSSSNRSPNSLTVDYMSSHSDKTYNRSKSPVSAFNHSSLRSATVIHNNQYSDKLMTVSPEPTVSKTSLTKTNLNPTELRNADGSRELRFPNGNVKYITADGKYSKFVYYNGDVKENFYNEGRIKYFYAETKTYHTTHADGLEVLEFPDGQVEKRYKDGSSEIRLPNGSIRYFDPKNEHVREEWRFPDGAAMTVSANGDRRVVFANGQVEVHAKDHKRREFPDGTVKLVYNDGTSETRYASGRVRIKDKHGNLIMDSAPG